MRKPNYRFERAERDRTKHAKKEEKAHANRSGRLRRDQVRQINLSFRLRAITDDKGKLAVPPLSPRAP